MLNRVTKKHAFIALIVAYFVLALIYSCAVPSFEAPDEVAHFAYITHLRINHRLPVQRVGDLSEAHQPPLYYAIAALFALPANLDNPTGHFVLNPQFMWAGQGGGDVNAGLHRSAETFPFQGQSLALHLARVASIVMGTVTVAFTVLITWNTFPQYPWIGLIAGAFVAFNPQYLFISSVVNNDNLIIMLATLCWWQLTKAINHPDSVKNWVLLGMWIGLAFLTKVNGGFVIGAVTGFILLICAIQKRSYKLFVKGTLAIVLTTLLLSVLWFVRNQLLYGDPFGWRIYRDIYGANLRYGGLHWWDLKEFYEVQFRSFWGEFGWMNVSLPNWIYWVFCGLCLLSVLGIVLEILHIKHRCKHDAKVNTISIVMLFLAFVTQQAYMLTVITQCNGSCYQGRYAFPAIAPMMILVSWGFSKSIDHIKSKTSSTLVKILAVLLIVYVAFFALVNVIIPTYPMVPLPHWRLWMVRHKTDIVFQDMFRLTGYNAKAENAGTEVEITLYWQAMAKPDFNYSAFVHLIDGSDQLVGQKENAPGEERSYPPNAWWQGDIIADTHVIKLSPPLQPGTYRFRVGLYNWATGEPLPAFVDDVYTGNFVILEKPVQQRR